MKMVDRVLRYFLISTHYCDLIKTDIFWDLRVFQIVNMKLDKYLTAKNMYSIKKWAIKVRQHRFFTYILYVCVMRLVGSVLVIKLYWWFAFSILDMRQRVRTCSVNCYWVLLGNNYLIVNSIFTFIASTAVFYYMNRGRPNYQICPYLD